MRGKVGKESPKKIWIILYFLWRCTADLLWHFVKIRNTRKTSNSLIAGALSGSHIVMSCTCKGSKLPPPPYSFNSWHSHDIKAVGTIFNASSMTQCGTESYTTPPRHQWRFLTLSQGVVFKIMLRQKRTLFSDISPPCGALL